MIPRAARAATRSGSAIEAVRYAPQRAFPAYAYLPGLDPHPTRDPRGHSFEARTSPGVCPPVDRWRENEDYLFGVDLYNHGYLWEAHEAWEGLWHLVRHDADQAGFLQGLIQCSAASLKIPMGQPAGLAQLAALGTARLAEVATRSGPRFMGLDLPAFVRDFRALAASQPASAEGRPRIELA